MRNLYRPGPQRTLAWATWGAGVAAGVAGVAFDAAGGAPAGHPQPPLAVSLFLAGGFVGFSSLGLVVVLRSPARRIGWLLLSAGGLFLAGAGAETAAKHFAVTGSYRALVAGLSWLDGWTWTVALSLVVVMLLLFPTGSVPGRRWRVALWVAVAAAAAGFVGQAFAPGRLEAGAHVTNPLGIAAARSAVTAVGRAGRVLQIVALLAAAASLAARYRRGDADRRQQLRWLGLAIAAVILSVPVAVAGAAAGTSLVGIPFLLAVVGIPAAIAVAVLRYRLYDIDVVVNRALLYLLLTGVVAGIFVAVVVGIGAAVGGTQRPALSVLAAAVVVVALNPARTVLQRTVDRVVFGRRATPYQVLTEFADRISGEWGAADVLRRMAAMTVDATGASVTAVYLRIDGSMRAAATAPPDVDIPNELGHCPGADFDLVHPIADRGETLGAIALRKPAGVRVTGADERVVGYLASHAGLLLGHVRLTTELEQHVADLAAQAEELRRSRERLVRAQDQERRRLERNLHDGAQQDLIAIMAKARLARNQIDRRDLTSARATVEELKTDAQQALTEVRELAHGIFPPVLADRGLVAAVQARAARLPLPVAVDAEGVGAARFAPDVEGAAYFVVAEAFANVVKHADAATVAVRIRSGDRVLNVVIRDDGRGVNGAAPGSGIIGMTDRVAALGGAIAVRRVEPRGTEVDVSIPLAEV